MGEDGAVLVDDEGAYHAEALPVDVVDTVGAGDALLAGVLASLARGHSPRRAIRLGVTFASRVVTVPGTTTPSTDGIRRSALELPLHVRSS